MTSEKNDPFPLSMFGTLEGWSELENFPPWAILKERPAAPGSKQEMLSQLVTLLKSALVTRLENAGCEYRP